MSNPIDFFRILEMVTDKLRKIKTRHWCLMMNCNRSSELKQTMQVSNTLDHPVADFLTDFGLYTCMLCKIEKNVM